MKVISYEIPVHRWVRQPMPWRLSGAGWSQGHPSRTPWRTCGRSSVSCSWSRSPTVSGGGGPWNDLSVRGTRQLLGNFRVVHFGWLVINPHTHTHAHFQSSSAAKAKFRTIFEKFLRILKKFGILWKRLKTVFEEFLWFLKLFNLQKCSKTMEICEHDRNCSATFAGVERIGTIFENFRKVFGNVRKTLSQYTYFGNGSNSFWGDGLQILRKVFGNLWKCSEITIIGKFADVIGIVRNCSQELKSILHVTCAIQ